MSATILTPRDLLTAFHEANVHVSMIDALPNEDPRAYDALNYPLIPGKEEKAKELYLRLLIHKVRACVRKGRSVGVLIEWMVWPTLNTDIGQVTSLLRVTPQNQPLRQKDIPL